MSLLPERRFVSSESRSTAASSYQAKPDSGFTDEGLVAFGRGKSVVCMDGLDLHDMLDKGLSFADVMAKKVRRYAETRHPFIRVRDLYA